MLTVLAEHGTVYKMVIYNNTNYKLENIYIISRIIFKRVISYICPKMVLYNNTNKTKGNPKMAETNCEKEEGISERYLKIFQKGFHYSQDGRGNRLILHLQGCNMKCPWCSNPEGMPPEGVLMTEKEWLREECCPEKAVVRGVLDRSVCAGCRDHACIVDRRQKGIRLSYKTYGIGELVEECIRSRPMFFDGGGVTLTGGEIGMQFEAVKELLRKLGEAGIHRAIESNGSHPGMGELVPYVEQWIMDVKHYDNEIHRKWVGLSNRQTIENLEKISAVHPDMIVRVPLIPGFNDAPEDAEGFADLFERKIKGNHTRVEFLTYHEFGRVKWEQCGKEYRMPAGHIEPGTVEYFEKVLTGRGIVCIRT